MEIILWFEVQFFWKLTELFPCIRLFYRHMWYLLHWNFVSKSLSSGYHGDFDDFLVLLLIIRFSSLFVYFLMFSRHLGLYKVLLLNDWSTPIITIYYLSRYKFNNPLIMIHCLSNESISRIVSTTLVNTRDLAHFAAWALLPYFWKKYSFPGGGSFWLAYTIFS